MKTNEDLLWVRPAEHSSAPIIVEEMEKTIDKLVALDMALQAARFENPTARRVIFVDDPCLRRDDKAIIQYHKDWMRAALVCLQSIKASCPDAKFEWLDDLIESCPLSPGSDQGQDDRDSRSEATLRDER